MANHITTGLISLNNVAVGRGSGNIPVPSSYTVGLSDVSAKDAGRTEDGTMYKLRIGQITTIEVEWKYVDYTNGARILSTVQSEYFTVAYLNPLTGEATSSEFYVGDRTNPLYNGALGLWESISFKLIERRVH